MNLREGISAKRKENPYANGFMRDILHSFLLAEIPYRKFMFFYALRNEFLRLGTEFHRFLFSQELNFLEKSGKFSSWELNLPDFSSKFNY